MESKLRKMLDKFYHDMTIAELRLQNNDPTGDKLTYNDLLYLSLIEAHPGEYTASKLAEVLFVSKPAVTQKVNELEKQGYIRKEQNALDKRVYHLYLIRDKYTEAYTEVTKRTNQEIVDTLSNDYTPQELLLFCGMMDKICNILLNETKETKEKK